MCRKVIDLDDKKLDRIRVSHVNREGFDIEDFSVHLIGTCSAMPAGQALINFF